MKTNNIIMGVLVAVIAVMGVAFAAFSTTLTIEGTASIDSNWQIDFAVGTGEGIVNGCQTTHTADVGGNASSATLSFTGNKAVVNATMKSPGDVVVCHIKATNSGSLAAQRDGFYLVADASSTTSLGSEKVYSDDFTVTLAPAAGAKLAANGASETLTITIQYNANATNQSPESFTFYAMAIYSQDVTAA